MNTKTLGWGLLAVGVVLVVAGATADLLGVGEGYRIGYKQISAMVVGAVAAVAGVVIARR